jgi:hypothetical protein
VLAPSKNWNTFVVKNFTTCNRYILSSPKNINLDFYQDIRLQNAVSMEMLIPRSSAQRLGVKVVKYRTQDVLLRR